MWARLGSNDGERALRVGTVLAVALGVVLRLNLYAIHPSTLWEDEAYWAWKTFTFPVMTQAFRPAGFLALTKGLVTLLGARELTFRALPFLASIVSLSLSPYVARRLFSSGLTRLVVVTLMATHPAALTMGVEFKQYGVELGVFVALLAAFLRYRERPGPKTLALLLGLAWGAFLFSIIVIFLYPALFAVLAWDALKSRQLRRLALIVGAVTLCLATITTIYFTSWRRLDKARAEKKWGDKYHVFYVPDAEQSRASWTLGKYVEVAALPGLGREHWTSDKLSENALERLIAVDRAWWLGLHFAGIALLLRQRRLAELAWLWSPLLVLLLFNLGGRWPAGAFRVNSGLVPFTIFLSGFGLEALAVLRQSLARVLLPFGCALAIVPTLLMRPDWFQKGMFAPPGQFDQVLDKLAQSPPAAHRSVVLMDNSSCRPWRYYTLYDARLDRALTSTVRQRYSPKCLSNSLRQNLSRTAAEGDDFWVLFTDRKKDATADSVLRRSCRAVERTAVGGGLHVLWHCQPKRRPG
jgi:hypothetical protein